MIAHRTVPALSPRDGRHRIGFRAPGGAQPTNPAVTARGLVARVSASAVTRSVPVGGAGATVLTITPR